MGRRVEQPRSVIVSVRLSPAEVARLVADAQRGDTLSMVLRRKVLGVD